MPPAPRRPRAVAANIVRNNVPSSVDMGTVTVAATAKVIATEIQINRGPRTAAVGNRSEDKLAVAVRVRMVRVVPVDARSVRVVFARVAAGELFGSIFL